MLRLTKGEDGLIQATLFEKTTISNPYYLFVFTHTTNKTVVKFIKSSASDLSDYPERYNEWAVAASVFNSSAPGHWLYQVYEQESAVNLDPTGLTEVENGRLELVSDDQPERVGYSPQITINAH